MSRDIHIADNKSKNKFYGNVFDVSTEWVGSWSPASLVTNPKTIPKKFSAVRPKTLARKRRKKKRKERQLQN